MHTVICAIFHIKSRSRDQTYTLFHHEMHPCIYSVFFFSLLHFYFTQFSIRVVNFFFFMDNFLIAGWWRGRGELAIVTCCPFSLLLWCIETINEVKLFFVQKATRTTRGTVKGGVTERRIIFFFPLKIKAVRLLAGTIDAMTLWKFIFINCDKMLKVYSIIFILMK